LSEDAFWCRRTNGPSEKESLQASRQWRNRFARHENVRFSMLARRFSAQIDGTVSVSDGENGQWDSISTDHQFPVLFVCGISFIAPIKCETFCILHSKHDLRNGCSGFDSFEVTKCRVLPISSQPWASFRRKFWDRNFMSHDLLRAPPNHSGDINDKFPTMWCRFDWYDLRSR
jgi:hypothetical protein